MKVHPDGYRVKLVRDHVSEALGGDGTITYREMPREEHVEQLRKKLIEEAVEYVLDPSLDELSHVLEALQCLVTLDLEVDWEDLERRRYENAEERGGFTLGIGMYAYHPFDRT